MAHSTHNSTTTSSARNILTTARGTGILAFGDVLQSGGRFAIAFLLARLLGAQEYGLYILGLSVMVIASNLGKLALDAALVRYVAIYRSKHDEARLWGALQIGVGGALVGSTVIGVLLYVVADPIAIGVFDEPKLAALLKLFSILVPFLTLSDVLVGASRGFKKMEYAVIAENLAQTLLRLVLIGFFAIFGLSSVLAVVSLGLADLAASIILIYLLHGEFHLIRPLRAAHYEFGEIFRYALPLLFSRLLSKFRGNIQAILLGAFATVASAGVFVVANKINVFGRMASAAIMTSSRPMIAELHANNDQAQMGDMYQTTSRWIFAANFPLVLAMIVFAEPIMAIFGDSFAAGATALSILAWANLVNVSTGMSGVMIDMTGYTKLKLVNSVIQIALYIGGNLLLIPRWGIVGAASAALIALSFMHILRLVEVWFLLRLLPYNRSFRTPVIAALVTALVAVAFKYGFMTGTNLLLAVLQVLVLFGVYGGVSLLLGLPQEDRDILTRTYHRASAGFSHVRTMLDRSVMAGKLRFSAAAKKSAS